MNYPLLPVLRYDRDTLCLKNDTVIQYTKNAESFLNGLSAFLMLW